MFGKEAPKYEIFKYLTNSIEGAWLLAVFVDGVARFQVAVGPETEWRGLVDSILIKAEKLGLVNNDMERSEFRYEAAISVAMVHYEIQAALEEADTIETYCLIKVDDSRYEIWAKGLGVTGIYLEFLGAQSIDAILEEACLKMEEADFISSPEEADLFKSLIGAQLSHILKDLKPVEKVHISSAEQKEIALARLAGVAQKFLNESPIFDKKLDKEGLWDLIESGALSSRELGQAFGAAIKKEVFRHPEAE